MLDKAANAGRAPLREHIDDRYDTAPAAVSALLTVEKLPKKIWEPCCGTGNIVGVLRAAGHIVRATDLNARGCPDSGSGIDFLQPLDYDCEDEAIVTNPPYSLAEHFVATALARVPLVVMLLRLPFLESERRSSLLDTGKLARVHVFANRLPMMHREGWTGRRASSAIAFAWFCWEREHNGAAIIDRIRWREGDDPRTLPGEM
jgi:hypothetical protein